MDEYHPHLGPLADTHPPLVLISLTHAHPQRIGTGEHDHEYEWKAGVTPANGHTRRWWARIASGVQIVQ
jgi:hypothetical protein